MASLIVPTNAKKRKGSGEPRKAKYMKKILSDDKATKLSSFKKRLPTLMNKSYQLETLCDVPVCVVCFDADGNVETWPKDKAEVEARVFRYMAAGEKEKRESNVIALLEGTKKSLEKKVAACFSDLAGRLSPESLDAELKRIEERIESFKSEDQRVHATDQGRGTGSGLEDEFYTNLGDIYHPNGSELVKVEASGEAVQENPSNALLVVENGPCCNFEDDLFLDLEDIMGPQSTDLVNPVQEFNNSSAFIFHNSCTDLDDTIVGPNPNHYDSAKAEEFGYPNQVAASNCLPAGDNSCMKNIPSCSFWGDCTTYLDDIVGPSFSFDACSNGFGGMGDGLTFGGFC